MFYNPRQVIHELINPCTPPQYSFIRGLQGIPELPPVDVYVNGMLRAKNLGYKDLTPYMPSGSEKNDVQIFLAGTKEKPLLDIKELPSQRGQIITFVILGSVEDIKLLPIVDDINEKIMPDETKIRFYNLDSSNISFDMTMANGSISKSLGFAEGTEYTEINPGDHRFEVRSSNPNIRPITMNITLKPGRIYTVYITGSVDPHSPKYAQGNIPQIILAVDGNTTLTKCLYI